MPAEITDDQLLRYARHIILDEVGFTVGSYRIGHAIIVCIVMCAWVMREEIEFVLEVVIVIIHIKDIWATESIVHRVPPSVFRQS